jgi:plastocyanin
MKWEMIRSKSYLPTLACLLMLCPSGQAKSESGDKAAVTIDSFQFQPKKVTVRKGETVTFTNHDAAPHTVSPAKGATFTGTGRLLKDESKTVQFNDAGTQEYLCDFHPSMKGSVIVVDK